MRRMFNFRTLLIVAAFSATGALIAFITKRYGIVEDPTVQYAIWWGATALGAGVASRPS